MPREKNKKNTMYILHYIIYLKTPPIPSMMSKSTEPSFEKNHKQEFHVVSSPRGVEYITAFQRHLKKKKEKKRLNCINCQKIWSIHTDHVLGYWYRFPSQCHHDNSMCHWSATQIQKELQNLLTGDQINIFFLQRPPFVRSVHFRQCFSAVTD